MNCLEISLEYPPYYTGGIGPFVYVLAKELARLGLDIHVLCGGAVGSIRTTREGELAVTRLPLPNFPPRNLWFQIKGLGLIRRCLSQADVVHGHSTLSTVMALANHGFRKPWIVTVHGLFRRTFPLTLTRPITERALGDDVVYTFGFPYSEGLHRIDLRAADYLVFVARHMLEDACNSYGDYLSTKSSAIWAPVGEQALTDSMNPSRQDLTFAYVGRFYWLKGVTTLIGAFSRLAKTSRGTWLRLYGSGPMERVLRKRVLKLGLYQRVQFRGWMSHSDLLSELSDIDVFVFPSLYEACPVAVLEAMSLGKPVIVSDLPWGREFVKDGITGLLSRPEENALYERMETLLGNKDLRIVLGKNARAFVASNFRPSTIARAYARLLDKMT
jgi:glycosyltransferase involved in cell wall biosynthesis